uniref:EXPERA domain-containing protein n=1 Tax=Arcella intermedia TaxID=1963864 RepID=A0A6B2LPM2_9EUKA
MDVFAGQFQWMGMMSQHYLKVDPRYIHGLSHVSGHSVFMTSMVELLLQTPLCIATYWGFHHQSPWRRVTQLAASILHLSGMWWMYYPEALAGFPHLEIDRNFEFTFDHILYYWFGYCFCCTLWTVVPVYMCYKAAKEISQLIQAAGIKKMN